MEKEKRINNPQVREFAYKFVPEKLNNNPIFVKLFGQDFAEKRSKANVYIVFTNEKVGIDKVAGYQNEIGKSVTICKSGENGFLLMPEDILKSHNLQEILIHEFIHAIFTRTKEECSEYGIVMGTGLLRIFNNKIELGRGLNEGWTEWMCEKAGFKPRTYKELTNFIRLIETAIGTEKTMELGKGEFSSILDMPEVQVDAIFGFADDVYKIDESIRFNKTICESLKDITKEELSKDSELYIEYSKFVKKMKKNKEFLNWISEEKKEVTTETIYEYLDTIYIPNLVQSKNTTIAIFESTVLYKYFVKDLEELFQRKEILEEDYLKCVKLESCLNTDLNNLPSYVENAEQPMAVIRVIKGIEQFKDRYIKQVAKEEALNYKTRELGLINLIEHIRRITVEDYNLQRKFIQEFAKIAEPEHIEEISDVIEMALKYYNDDRFLESLVNSSLYKLSSRR